MSPLATALLLGVGLTLPWTADVRAQPVDEPDVGPPHFELLDARVAPGERVRLELPVSESFVGSEVGIAVEVIHGMQPGEVLCLTAGVHGDEVNGIEVVRRVLLRLDPARVSGTVVGVPIVNLHGFRRGSRYLPDRRDLNRHFPGRRFGSAASRVAHALFEGVVRHCDRLLDFHTGSLERTNFPHARADLTVPSVLGLVESLDGWAVLQHAGKPGTLRRAATNAGVATVTFEVGGPVRLDEQAVLRTVDGILRLPGLGAPPEPTHPPEIYGRSRWIRADRGGLLLTRIEPGDHVEAGQVLGVVVDPLASHETEIRAPGPGRVLGMAWSQVVIPGFAAFHLGIPGAAGPPTPGADALASEEIPE